MPFVFSIQTSGTDDTFTLPTISGGTYDATVDWGDGGPTSAITSYDDADITHTYATEDEYEISITGTFYGWSFDNGGDCAMMRDISDWGNGVFRLGATTGHFHGCVNMTCSDTTGAPDITGVTSLSLSFNSCSSLTTLGDLSSWDVSGVTSFSLCFFGCSSLITLGDLSSWDVSGVTTFYACFSNCSSLTTLGDLSSWDVSAATTFYVCFYNCSSLTTLGDLSSWDVSGVTSFTLCFSNCPAISDEIYSNMLVAWAKLSLQSGTNAHFGNAQYLQGAPTNARAIIDATWGTITDGGQHPYLVYPSDISYFRPLMSDDSFNDPFGDIAGWVAAASAGTTTVPIMMNHYRRLRA